jgi:DNA polymerase-3 subunit alpha
MDECRRMGITVDAPDINESDADFTVVGDRIRFGLAAVKGIGDRAIEAIVAARTKVGRFKSLMHFCENVDLSAVNRSVVESLVKCGAFDSTGARHSQLAAVLERALAAGAEMQSDSRRGQMNLFGAFAAGAGGPQATDFVLPDIPEWPESKLSEFEKASLGLYVNHNPLGPYKQIIRNFAKTTAADLPAFKDSPGKAAAGKSFRDNGPSVTVGGRIKSVRPLITKTGRSAGAKMAVFDLEDVAGGSISCVIFPKDYAKFESAIQADRVVFVKGRVDCQREDPQIQTSEVLSVDEGVRQWATAISLRLKTEDLDEAMLNALRQVLQRHPGSLYVHIEMEKPNHSRTIIRAGDNLRVAMNESFERDIKDLLGGDHLVLVANGGGVQVRL